MVTGEVSEPLVTCTACSLHRMSRHHERAIQSLSLSLPLSLCTPSFLHPLFLSCPSLSLSSLYPPLPSTRSFTVFIRPCRSSYSRTSVNRTRNVRSHTYHPRFAPLLLPYDIHNVYLFSRPSAASDSVWIPTWICIVGSKLIYTAASVRPGPLCPYSATFPPPTPPQTARF